MKNLRYLSVGEAIAVPPVFKALPGLDVYWDVEDVWEVPSEFGKSAVVLLSIAGVLIQRTKVKIIQSDTEFGVTVKEVL